MKKDEAKQLGDTALNELAAQLAAGKSDELVRYLTTMSRFHHYSFGNCLLIAVQCPAATLVAGFRAWQKLGRQVKKGQKGICIFAPMVGKKEADNGEEQDVFGFRAVHVFDVSQTEGDDLPDTHQVSGNPGDELLKLHQVTRSLGIELSYEADLGGADGVSKMGRIVLLEGNSPAKEFNTLAHEMGHELLHLREERQKLPNSVKELEAEAVAFVVSTAAGLTGSLKHSADYIQCHAGDAEQLQASLERIGKATTTILAALESAGQEPIAEVA